MLSRVFFGFEFVFRLCYVCYVVVHYAFHVVGLSYDCGNVFCLFPVKAGAPGNLTVNDVGPHSMELSWAKPRNDGGSPIKGVYVVIRSLSQFKRYYEACAKFYIKNVLA